MLFYDDWSRIEILDDIIHIHSFLSMKDLNTVIDSSLKEIVNRSTNAAFKYIGPNPVLCLSGGIDSQAMINLWDKKFPFTAVIFQFDNDLNKFEFEDAVKFAESRNISYKVIKLDILRFLQGDLISFARKYSIISPQFAVHAYFLTKVKELGYTGAAMGGNSYVIFNNYITFMHSRAVLTDIEKFSKISNFPCIPNFLGFHKDICLRIALSCGTLLDGTEESRYQNKVNNYKTLGLDIIPQRINRTGFEEIKQFYNKDRYEGAFEMDFRQPLYYYNKNGKVLTFMNKEVSDFLIRNGKDLNMKIFGSINTGLSYVP